MHRPAADRDRDLHLWRAQMERQRQRDADAESVHDLSRIGAAMADMQSRESSARFHVYVGGTQYTRAPLVQQDAKRLVDDLARATIGGANVRAEMRPVEEA